MKRKSVLFIVVTSILGLFLYAGACKLMGYPIFVNNKNKSYVTPVYSGHEGELLPNIDLLMLDSVTHINIADIPPGKPTVLFYFGPYCPYCQAEIDDIVKNMESLQEIQIYLLTTYSYGEMKSFYIKNNLEKFNNIRIGIDYGFQFSKYFNTILIPCTAIYNTNKKLNSVYIGTLSHDQIKKVSEE